MTFPFVARSTSTVPSVWAAAPAGGASTASALASETNVFRLRCLDTMISVEEGHRLAHLQDPRARPTPDMITESLRLRHIGGHEDRALVLVPAVDDRVELLQAPLVLLRHREVLEDQEINAPEQL